MTNQRPVSWSRDPHRPIRGQYCDAELRTFPSQHSGLIASNLHKMQLSALPTVIIWKSAAILMLNVPYSELQTVLAREDIVSCVTHICNRSSVIISHSGITFHCTGRKPFPSFRILFESRRGFSSTFFSLFSEMLMIHKIALNGQFCHFTLFTMDQR